MLPPYGTPIFRSRPIGDAEFKGYAQMSDFNRGYARTVATDRADMSVDAGLRSFMLGVYNKMALGLLLSAALGWVTSSYPPVRDAMFIQAANGRVGLSAIGMVIGFAPIAATTDQ